MMKNRKTRYLIAVASALAGMLAYVLLPTVTTHTMSTTSTLNAQYPKGSSQRLLEIGPAGTTPQNTSGSSTANYANMVNLQLTSTKSYAQVPDPIYLGSTMATPWAMRVSVTPSAGVRVVPVLAEVWMMLPAVPATDMEQVYRFSPVPAQRGAAISLTGNGREQLVLAGYDLIVKRPGNYTLALAGNGQVVKTTLDVVAPPAGYAIDRVENVPATASGFGVGAAGVPSGAKATLSVIGSLSRPSYSIHRVVTVTAPVKDWTAPGYIGGIPAIGPDTSGRLTVRVTAAQTGFDMYGAGWGTASSVVYVHDPAHAVTSTTRNPLWIVLGLGLALLALVAPGRRNRDGGDEGDGQDGKSA